MYCIKRTLLIHTYIVNIKEESLRSTKGECQTERGTLYSVSDTIPGPRNERLI
jgi:hypothetical protein